MALENDNETKQSLLKLVKKEVKQIMEEAVTRKFVHEESSSITLLCGAVEQCLQLGLKKRALGLFKNTSSTLSLLQKVAKNFEPAEQVAKIVDDIEINNDPIRKQISQVSLSLDNNRNQQPKKLQTLQPNIKYLWIRVALFEKVLDKIIDYLVENANKYYEKDSLVSDPCCGPILASLLVGPCALDFTKMKTVDHLWTDPPADELVQRHRIHSSSVSPHFVCSSPGSPRRPGLQVFQRRSNNSSSSDESQRSMPNSAKDYVESLHQNSKQTLLYGKNNVHVQPKEDMESLPGYLSLHQTIEGLILKWTPNQLMNGSIEDSHKESVDRSVWFDAISSPRQKYRPFLTKKHHNIFWDYAQCLFMDEIVYLHCHQQPDCGGTIVLVGQDGVQRSPIHFPKGGHLLAFLSCLETGLLPHAQLDPPLWSQKGKGKVFPKLKRKGSRLQNVDCPADSEEEATDYVFRIITTYKPTVQHQDLMESMFDWKFTGFTFPWQEKDAKQNGQTSPNLSPTVQNYARSQQLYNSSCITKAGFHRTSIRQLCDTMKRQIISRAFYGWLAHCRHLKTVRTHLSGLVNHALLPLKEREEASQGLTRETWEQIMLGDHAVDPEEIYRLVYFGGVAHEIRKEVWPYLLGHYKFGSTQAERDSVDTAVRTAYEQTMSEWLAVEAIVRQREKDSMAANLAKVSQESTDGHIPLVRKDSSLSNEVFLDGSLDVEEGHHHYVHLEEPLIEESSTEATTPESPKNTPGINGYRVVHDGKMAQLMREKVKGQQSPDEGLGGSLRFGSSSGEQSKRLDSSDTDVTDKLEEDPPVIRRLRLMSHNGAGSVDSGGGLEDFPISNDTSLDEDHQETSTQLVMSHSPTPNGGIYTVEMLDTVSLNLHRIDKDVHRCDRNHVYFTQENLDKLRNIMCTYVWENLNIGYIQGMCDLLAPLLVIFDDEAMTYSCFCELMKRMTANFPHGGAMDVHFANMRSLIQILDVELFEHMHHHGDYTHFYFCYRWFLLDFKRELVYEDVYSVWETIWAAKHVSSANFVLFIALALVEYYRDIILDNNMDFTDIIKFFNEMAEHHNAPKVLQISRDLVYRLQDLIDNKE